MHSEAVPGPGDLDRMKAAYQRYDHGRVGRWSGGNPGNQRISKERFRDLEDLMNQAGVLPLAGKRILDIGCAGGWVLASMQRYGAQPENLFGVDVREDRIRDARCAHPGLHFALTDGRTLEYGDASFDVILFFTVFSSMLDHALRRQVAAEADRVLRPGGAILWYDMRYRSLTNPDTRPCGKRTVRELFPVYRHFLRTTTLLPPLARNLGKLTGTLYPVLNSLPPLRSHYAGVFLKP